MKRWRSPAALLLSLATLHLAGCATPTPSSSKAVKRIFEPVPNYESAPCEYQRKWAAHNSKVATLKAGKEVVYKAPCDVDKPKVTS